MDSRSRGIFSTILFKNTPNVLSQGEMHHMREMKSVLLICYPAKTNNALDLSFKKVWNKPVSYFDDQDKVKHHVKKKKKRQGETWLDGHVTHA
jgi:hypothetical protein